ncbi:ABC transporter permease [Pelagibacterium montanilacus]|uniref:ABC transporter permease n=1 Tax=Pelagibacterium montanilacus TaxID=2185280 RepID=UPI0019D1BA29|nr:ABC transporter permease [Pelagibacterium montanilacus]
MSAVAEKPARMDDNGLIVQLWAAIRREPITQFFLFILIIIMVVAAFADFIAPYNPVQQSLLRLNQMPSADHWLGTDHYGRDVLSRIIYGARNSLLIGIISPIIAAVVGTFLGVVAGYFGGWADRLISRVVDLLLAFPALLLGILVAAALGSGFWDMVAVLTVAFAPQFARIARASTLAMRSEPFVEAAVSCGVGPLRIIARHILPNISGSIVVVLTLWIATAIRLEATLSFLGLGTQAPNPSWGNIIRDGLNNIFGSSWPIIAAGAAITLTVLAFNMVGDAVRDVLDPETRDD